MSKSTSSWVLGIASVAMSLSLVACTESSLDAKVRKDGSIDFVASGQVTQTVPEAGAGIAIDEDQGIAIDPTAIEEGSLHIRILLPDDRNAVDDPEATAPEGTTEPGDGEETETAGDKGAEGDGAATDDPAASDEASKKEAKEEAKETSSSTLTGAVFASAFKPVVSNTIPGKVVFDRTLSALDDNSEILTVTDVEEGYYLIYVTADHATGTVKIRPYDLSPQEIIDRDSQKMVDKTRDFFTELFGDGKQVAEAAEEPSQEAEPGPDDTKIRVVKEG